MNTKIINKDKLAFIDKFKECINMIKNVINELNISDKEFIVDEVCSIYEKELKILNINKDLVKTLYDHKKYPKLLNIIAKSIICRINENKNVNEIIEELKYVPTAILNYFLKYDNNNYETKNKLKIRFEQKSKTKNNFEFRFKQKDVYEKFIEKIDNEKEYQGLLIAPTGWGKSMMHLLFIGYYWTKYNKNIIITTKRKDIIEDILENNNKTINKTIKLLKMNNYFPEKEYEIFCPKNKEEIKKINNKNNCIMFVNSDKILGIENRNDVNFDNIGFVIFDESHWCGANKLSDSIRYIKNNVNYLIGSSATPIREGQDNQNNIKEIFNDFEILHQISYKEAWENGCILPIEHHLVILDSILSTNKEECILSNETKNKTRTKKINNIDKNLLLVKISDILKNKSVYKKAIFYFSDRKSLLEFYTFIEDKKILSDYKKHITMTFNKTSSNKVMKSKEKYNKTKTKLANIRFQNDVNNREITKLLTKLNLLKYDFNNSISNFKKDDEKSILFAVHRATEGFDDKKIDVVADLSYVENPSIGLKIQKMGRAQRIDNAKRKKMGFYIYPISNNHEQLFMALANYIKTITLINQNKNINNSSSDIYNAIKIINHFNINFSELEFSEIYEKVKKLILNNYSNKKKFEVLKIDIKNKFHGNFIKIKDFNKLAIKNHLPTIEEIKEEFKIEYINYYDLLSYDTSVFIQTLSEWKKYCKEKKINSSREYYMNLDEKLPSEPSKFYPNFRDIDTELGNNTDGYLFHNNK